jgi:hypothetical protein
MAFEPRNILWAQTWAVERTAFIVLIWLLVLTRIGFRLYFSQYVIEKG